ncbi:VOC family protein [Pseudonocardia phyllosphaerae]|uniref:VOC family protein n=1 Tax=Pseudonocardia phyllosphaerae TaxID=3390502 RepID=UPI00397DF98E
MTTTWALTVDCVSPAVVAAFWRAALGYVDAPAPDGFASWEDWFAACGVPADERDDGAALVDPAGVAPGIGFLRVPERKQGKNRLHLDLKVSGGRSAPAALRGERIRAEVLRLTAIGASVVGEHAIGGELDHVVLADPEGNEFCVV